MDTSTDWNVFGFLYSLLHFLVIISSPNLVIVYYQEWIIVAWAPLEDAKVIDFQDALVKKAFETL